MRLKRLKKTIWKSGGNYVTSFPRDWAEEIKQRYNSEVELVKINNKVIVTPPFNKVPKRSLRVKMDVDEAELKMKIIAAYLKGYNAIELQTTSPLTEENKRLLFSIFPDMAEPELTPDRCYRITFLPLHEISLKENYKKIKTIFSGLKDVTIESFKAFPEIETLRNDESYIGSFERRLDSMTFHARRYLNIALLYGDIFEKTELKSDEDIIYVNNIFSSFERLGDLHKDMIERLIKIAENQKAFLDQQHFSRVFLNYYDYAYEIIQVAIDALENPHKGMEVIRGKISVPKWSSYKNGVLMKAKDEMKNYILHQQTPELIRHLTILEGKMRAIPDIASNICEFAYNMIDPAKLYEE